MKMSEATRLALAALFFAIMGIFLLVLPGSAINKGFGILCLIMALLGAVAVFQRLGGKEFRDLFGQKAHSKARQAVETQTAVFEPGEMPTLSDYGKKQLERAVSVLNSLKVFQPERMNAALLKEAVADRGEPVTVECVLQALEEADYYNPSFDKSKYTANLVSIGDDTEQTEETVRWQVIEILHLSGESLKDSQIKVRIDASGYTTVDFTLDGEPVKIAYTGFPKNLSTVVAVNLAKRFQSGNTGRRFASLWSDQGVFITAIADGKLDELNKALGKGLTTYAKFGWLDEEEPLDSTSMPVVN